MQQHIHAGEHLADHFDARIGAAPEGHEARPDDAA
jgi:hypothetical protein